MHAYKLGYVQSDSDSVVVTFGEITILNFVLDVLAGPIMGTVTDLACGGAKDN